MVQNIIRVTVIFFMLSLTACASKSFDPSDAYDKMTETEIFTEGKASLKNEYYADAIQYFETYDARYPFGKDIEQVQLDIIYAYYQKDDKGASLAAAERFIHLHPTSKRVDYAYYMLGLSNFLSNVNSIDKHLPIDFATRDLTNAKKSFLQFSELVHRFPKSLYTEDAKQHMIFLQNMLAMHEYEVALFYYKRNAFVASANRANEVVRHFQGAPIIPKAMVLMIKSYHQLGMEELSLEATKVLEANVSDIPDIPEII